MKIYARFKIVLLSLAITILILLGILNCLERELKVYKGISFNELQRTCNTGDIILFRWNDIDLGFRIFSKFSHVGMIYKKNKRLYILETHPEGETSNIGIDTSGVHLHNLKKRIRYYNGTVYYAKLNLSNDAKLNLSNDAKLNLSNDAKLNLSNDAKPTIPFIEKYIKNNLKRYKSIPFDDNFRNEFVISFIKYSFGLQGKCKGVDRKKSMYCSEFIMNILDDICLVETEKLPPVSPGSFEGLKHKCGNFMFEKLHRIHL
jgi:hypothetical protein